MDYAPPPNEHLVRPHHILLLTLLIVLFKDEETYIPPAFKLHLCRELLNEISEVTKPRCYSELMQVLCSGPQSDARQSQRLIEEFKATHGNLSTPEKMTDFFSNLSCLFVERDDRELSIFDRHSLFGYFVRRCQFSFNKLSFSGVITLQKDYEAWLSNNSKAGYAPARKDELNDDRLLLKTQGDKKTWAKADAYAAFQKADLTGDEKTAKENLRRFFEQHFHYHYDSGLRQHALLNLVRMHYLRNEITIARELLSEAITAARTNGDRTTLQHCISLYHRLPPTHGRKPMLNELQNDVHPLEVLFDTKKLLDEQNGQPLTAAFIKIYQALGLYDQWQDTHNAGWVEDEQWAYRAIQSIAWEAAGCQRIASLEETLVVAFTHHQRGDNNRLTVLLNKAYRSARQGGCIQAISMLLEPDVWRGLSIHDYGSWANEIWHILALRASRRGQLRLYYEFLLPRKPPGDYHPRDYLIEQEYYGSEKTIRDCLYEVLHMRCGQAVAAIEPLLRALWHSEFLGRLSDYRTAIILLADVSLEFELSGRARQIMEEIMPQVILGDDLEQRAFGCFTFARCIVAAGNTKAEAICEAIPYLLRAERDLRVLEMYQSLMDVQYLLAVFYHNINKEKERDEASKRHHETQEWHKKLGGMAADDELQETFRVISRVGGALASRGEQ